MADRLVTKVQEQEELKADLALTAAFAAVLNNPQLDDAFKSKLLSLPGESAMANQIATNIDPAAIHDAHKFAKHSIAAGLTDELLSLYHSLENDAPYSSDPDSVGRRSLRNSVLDYLVCTGDERTTGLAVAQSRNATNLNDRFAALSSLARAGGAESDKALAEFYAQNRQDHLLVDKWLTLNAMKTDENAIANVRSLLDHEAFSLKRPNRVRSLIGAFSMLNQVRFNDPSGQGYALVADVIMQLDEINPQVAARMSSCFKSWSKLEPGRSAAAKSELEKVAAKASLSRDLREMIERTLKG